MQNNSKLVHRRQEVANRGDIKVEAARRKHTQLSIDDLITLYLHIDDLETLVRGYNLLSRDMVESTAQV